ncbi:MAG: hypothetical protein GY789_00745 [Hyphomicrobiales bacterium]|nr:hypothetical protein [Hyphomicrobiales bacterium]MCP5001936.1 hypothetical protein [Hyphomicrobiales bacterium]
MNTKTTIRNADHVDVVITTRNARAEWFKAFFKSITKSAISRYRTKPNPLIMRGLHIS